MAYRIERLDRGIKLRTDGIYSLISNREMLYLSGPRLIPVLLLLIVPLILEPYWRVVLLDCLNLALLTISWDFLANFIGLFSLGQAFFFAAGSYLLAVFNVYLGLPIVLAMPAATICGAIVSTILVIPTLRLRGIFFALSLFLIPLLSARVIEAFNILGGTEGIRGIAALPNTWVEQYGMIIVVLITLFGARRLVNTDYGMIFRAIRNDEQVVKSIGINVPWKKIQAVFLATLPCAFSGAWMCSIHTITGLQAFALDYTILPIAACVVGGPGTLAGAAYGAFLLGLISNLLREFGGYRMVFFAVILLIFSVYWSEGIFTYLRRKYFQFERKVEL